MQQPTHISGPPVVDNANTQTAGLRGPAPLQDIRLLEKLAHLEREEIPERHMHAKRSGAFDQFKVTHDISHFTKARQFGAIGKKAQAFVRLPTVAGERGVAAAERDVRGLAVKFYTEEFNWDMVGNNTSAFCLRDPLRFPDLNHSTNLPKVP